MEQLLTKKDLGVRWQVTTKTIETWVKDGKLEPCNVPGDMRFTLEYIQSLEGIKANPLSPMERRRLESELEEWNARALGAERIIDKMHMISTESIYKRSKTD